MKTKIWWALNNLVLCTRHIMLKMKRRVCKGVFHLALASIHLGIHGNLSHMSQKLSQRLLQSPVAAITVRRAFTCFAPCVHERWICKSDAFRFSQKFSVYKFTNLFFTKIWLNPKLINFTKILNCENLEPYGKWFPASTT